MYLNERKEIGASHGAKQKSRKDIATSYMVEDIISIIGDRAFALECIVRTLQAEFRGMDVCALEGVQELSKLGGSHVRLVILCAENHSLSQHTLQTMATVFDIMPAVPVVVVSDCDDGEIIAETIRHGASGYLLTTLSVEVAVAALRVVLAGGVYVPQQVMKSMLRAVDLPDSALKSNTNLVPADTCLNLNGMGEKDAGLSALTPRERQVLETLRRGRSNKTIASELNMSENTVKVHIRHIMQKLNATNRTQAVFMSQLELEKK